MIKKNILFAIILINWFLIKPAYSQELFNVTGTVYNSETGERIPNASIIVPGTQKGTSSGNEGNFELKLEKGEYKIRCTSVGYAPKEIFIRITDVNPENVRIGLLPKEHEIEDVDVVGRLNMTDRDTSIDRVPLSLAPAVSRVNAVDIEKMGAVTLTDALKHVTGAWIENRGRKTKQFFSVRGQKYPYPDYSIDGVWQKEFEETGYFLSALDIESVEIVRSSSALVKGLSGLTGVVDIRTKKPEHETFSFLAKYGTLNNIVASLQYGNKIKGVTFNTSAAFFGTDGPPARKGKERIANFHGTLDWEINPKLKLAAGSAYIYGLREFVSILEPGAPNIMNREEKFDPVRTLLTYVKLDYSGEDGSKTGVQTNLSYRDADFISRIIPQGPTTTTPEKDWEYGFNILHSRRLSQTNTFRFGGLYNHWVAPNGKRYYTGRRCDVHTWSGVIADEQKAGRFIFDTGFRYIGGYIEEWGGFGIEGSAAGFQNVAPIKDQAAPPEWQSALGASFISSSSLSLHYNFTGGTISPRQGSLNSDGSRPDNEARFQHELGVRLKTNNLNEITVSTFFTQRKNAIDYSGKTITLTNGLVMELYENLNKRSYGIELSGKWNVPGLHSSVSANAMLMKGEKESGGKMKDDNQLPNIILNAGLYFDYSGFDANLFVNYTGPYFNNRFVNPVWVQQHGDFPLGNFVSADWNGGYTFSGRISTRIFAEVKNILNKKYMTVAGYPEPGRLFSTGVKVFF